MVIDTGLGGSALEFPCAAVVSYLFRWVPDGVLQQVDEIRRTKLSKTGKRFGSGVNRLVENLLGDSISA